MKKLLLISNKVFHYRVSIYNYFARNFREHGWAFIVRSNELQKDSPYHIQFDFKEIPFNFFIYKKEIEDINPDVVIIFLHLKDIIMWSLIHWLKIKKIPIVYWNHGINLLDPQNKLKYFLFNYLHTLSNAIILYSENEMKYIKKKNRHKVSIANNTINFEDIPEIKESKEQIKKELDIQFEKVVLFVGRIQEYKKLHHLIEIFNEKNTKGIGLVIVGKCLYKGILEKMNKDNTMYLGEIYDPVKINKIYKMADVFSMPGVIGLSLNHAFYWGLPVVTENTQHSPEICHLKNGYNGFIVQNNDVIELKNKISLLLENDAKRLEFSNNARKEIFSNGSIINMFNGFINCLNTLTQFRNKTQ